MTTKANMRLAANAAKLNVIVTHWSEFHNGTVAQLMSISMAQEHFSRLSESQRSAYSIRDATAADFEHAYPIIRQRPLGNVGADSEVRVGRLREDEERSQNDNSSEAEVS